MSIRRNRKAVTLAIKVSEIGVAAPVVIAHRLARMAHAGSTPSARDRREYTLMGTEKLAAFSESWNAMFIQAMRTQQDIAASTWCSFWFPWVSARSFAVRPAIDLPAAALRVLSKGVAPVHRRALANAKRLSRTTVR